MNLKAAASKQVLLGFSHKEFLKKADANLFDDEVSSTYSSESDIDFDISLVPFPIVSSIQNNIPNNFPSHFYNVPFFKEHDYCQKTYSAGNTLINSTKDDSHRKRSRLLRIDRKASKKEQKTGSFIAILNSSDARSMGNENNPFDHENNLDEDIDVETLMGPRKLGKLDHPLLEKIIDNCLGINSDDERLQTSEAVLESYRRKMGRVSRELSTPKGNAEVESPHSGLRRSSRRPVKSKRFAILEADEEERKTKTKRIKILKEKESLNSDISEKSAVEGTDDLLSQILDDCIEPPDGLKLVSAKDSDSAAVHDSESNPRAVGRKSARKKRRRKGKTKYSMKIEFTDEFSTVRETHNAHERQRREELRSAFFNLRDLLPTLGPESKSSKILILRQASEMCQVLTKVHVRLVNEKKRWAAVIREKKLAVLRAVSNS